MRKHQILLLLFVSMHCLAQDPKIDSLRNVLKKQNDDTSRVNTLNILSEQLLLATKIDEAKKYASDALLLARKISFKEGEALSHKNFGIVYLREYNYAEAMKSFNAFLKLAKEIDHNSFISEAFIYIAQTYDRQGKYTEALQNHFAVLRLSKEMNDKPKIIGTYQNLGFVYWKQGNYADAYLSFNAALNISTEIGDYKGIAMCHYMFGMVYYYEGNYPEAMKQWLSSLTIYTKSNDIVGISDCNNNIAAIYQTQKKYDEALKHLETALKINEQNGNKYRFAIGLNNIGEIYRDQGNYSKAFDKFKLLLNLSYEMNNKWLIALAHQSLGNLYYIQAENEINIQEKEKLLHEALTFTQQGLKDFNILNQKDDIAKSYNLIGLINIELKKFTDAKNVLNQSLVLSKEIGVKELLRDNYRALAKLDSLTGNWLDAYRNSNLYISYRDSLLNKENNEKIFRLQMQYEFDKKEDSLKYQQSITDEKLKQQLLVANQQKQSLLLRENEIVLLNNERQLTDLKLQNSATEMKIQKAETEKRQNQFVLVNKENDLQSLQIKKQKQFRNYLLIGFALLIAVASFGYYSYRTRQQLKLQKLRNKIASDLHDDIGSTLSSISIFSQMAQQQSKETIPFLEAIGENSQKMLDAMADIVWTINPENDQFEKIVLRMRNFAYELLGAKNIDFEFNADEEVAKMNISMDVRKNLYLIFKEATNNLVKYSGANKATFNIKAEKDNLTMLISDNGKGFNQQQTTIGNGLKNMKKRAEEIRAQIMIHSTPSNGTSIELKVAV